MKRRLTKTDKRIEWIKFNKTEIEKNKTSYKIPSRHKGHNARGIEGMSAGGWGWWARALISAGVKCGAQNYWSGSSPTPSTAINEGIANYISANAPAGLL